MNGHIASNCSSYLLDEVRESIKETTGVEVSGENALKLVYIMERHLQKQFDEGVKYATIEINSTMEQMKNNIKKR